MLSPFLEDMILEVESTQIKVDKNIGFHRFDKINKKKTNQERVI
jgi:hypothetical protein